MRYLVVLISCFIINYNLFSQDKIWTDGKSTNINVPTITIPDFSALAESLSEAVVNIYTTQIRVATPFDDPQMKEFFEFFFGPQSPQGQGRNRGKNPDMAEPQSLGTGFIISEDGYVLTNYHVIKNSDIIRIKTINSKETFKGYPAKLVGTDPEIDIALLKIDTNKKFKYVSLGDSGKVKIGEWVLAIGNPFGLEHTVSQGIISAKNRSIHTGLPYDNYLQTDASINPGNSGGPLFNMKGEVIGINNMIIAGAQGVGFAIPINTVKDYIPQLMKKGRVSKGYLGVGTQALTPELMNELGFNSEEGVIIASIEEDAPANQAGLQPGDIIVKFNENKIASAKDLLENVARAPVDSNAKVEVFRKGEYKIFNVKLAERPIDERLYGNEKLARDKKNKDITDEENYKIFGMTLIQNSNSLRQKYQLPISTGVLVAKVEQNSKAEDAGFERGDIIDYIDGENIKALKEFKNSLVKSKKKSHIMRVRRGMSYFFTSIGGN